MGASPPPDQEEEQTTSDEQARQEAEVIEHNPALTPEVEALATFSEQEGPLSFRIIPVIEGGQTDWRILAYMTGAQGPVYQSRDGLTKFHEILHRWFVKAGPTTRMLFEQQRGSFQDFAEEYHENFSGTSMYEEMKDEFGSRAFNDLENLIEEIIGLKFEVEEQDDTSEEENIFLADEP